MSWDLLQLDRKRCPTSPPLLMDRLPPRSPLETPPRRAASGPGAAAPGAKPRPAGRRTRKGCEDPRLDRRGFRRLPEAPSREHQRPMRGFNVFNVRTCCRCTVSRWNEVPPAFVGPALPRCLRLGAGGFGGCGHGLDAPSPLGARAPQSLSSPSWRNGVKTKALPMKAGLRF